MTAAPFGRRVSHQGHFPGAVIRCRRRSHSRRRRVHTSNPGTQLDLDITETELRRNYKQQYSSSTDLPTKDYRTVPHHPQLTGSAITACGSSNGITNARRGKVQRVRVCPQTQMFASPPQESSPDDDHRHRRGDRASPCLPHAVASIGGWLRISIGRPCGESRRRLRRCEGPGSPQRRGSRCRPRAPAPRR